jgi:hypothetical protein
MRHNDGNAITRGLREPPHVIGVDARASRAGEFHQPWFQRNIQTSGQATAVGIGFDE